MTTKTYSRFIVGGIVVCLTAIMSSGCKSVSNPLVRAKADFSAIPVDTLTEVAFYFEREVRDGNRTPELENRGDLIIDTPEIKQALRSRAARAHLVQELLDSGDSVEQFDGKIAIIRSAAYKGKGTKQDRDRNAMIVISENVDRVIIYDTLRKTNNLNSAARSAIEEIFFSTRKQALKPGQKFRGKEGQIEVYQG